MNQKITCLALGAMLLALDVSVEAQHAAKVPRLGYFTLSGEPSDRDEAFMQGLRELGWADKQNIVIEYRWVAGKTEQVAHIADELVRLKVDATSAPVIQAAKNTTNTIPIVMPAASDPVGSGFIASLARPAGNITGMSAMILELDGKRLELLREIAPRATRVAFLTYGTDVTSRRIVKELADTGRNRLPTISDSKDFFDAGGLASYGSDPLALWRRAAWYGDKILRV